MKEIDSWQHWEWSYHHNLIKLSLLSRICSWILEKLFSKFSWYSSKTGTPCHINLPCLIEKSLWNLSVIWTLISLFYATTTSAYVHYLLSLNYYFVLSLNRALCSQLELQLLVLETSLGPWEQILLTDHALGLEWKCTALEHLPCMRIKQVWPLEPHRSPRSVRYDLWDQSKPWAILGVSQKQK